MDVGRRAKQFAPFAALRGLDETIRQQEIIYEPKRDLSEEKKNELDMKLRILAYGMKIQATYFQKPIWDQVLLNGMYTALYAEHLLKRAHKAIQKWSAKNVAVHWRYL